jgi:PPOX class probable FMN-dependent enzyme
MTDPYRITSVEELRAEIGFPHPATEGKVLGSVDDEARAFIARSPLIVLATTDAEGRLDCSPKGDEPGFVLVADERTVIVPDRPGNRLAYGHQNIIESGRVGILFTVPNTAETLRINGRAELTRDPELLRRLAARNRPALLAIRVHVEECFFHCGKAFIRSRLWEPESWAARNRISFGKQYAKRVGADAATADAIDESIARDYRDNL